MQATDTIPYVSVRPSGVTMYNRPERPRSRSTAQREAERHLADNDHRGEISHKAERRISQGIDWLLYMAREKSFRHFKYQKTYKFRVNFVTLTLASKQIHSDQEIKSKLLNQFIIESNLYWGVEKYLWRAESQANGNIHFHIITDKFIPWSELRNTWNRIQDKLGYVQRSPHFKAGWTPNSTDVHSVRKVKKLGAYLAAYCCKKSKNRKIEGKQWGLSHSLSKMKSAIDERDSEIVEDLSKLYVARRESLKVYDWHSTYWVTGEELKELGCLRLYELLEEYRIGKEVEDG